MNPLIVQKYTIELYTRVGVLAADVSYLVKSLHFTRQRNEAEQLSFSIDLNAYEELCATLGTHPTAILGAYQTDVKLKRKGEYLFGVHVGETPVSLGENDQMIEVRAFGYLNLLIDRYVSPAPFVQEDPVDIAWSLIDETQSQTNGNLGITQGATQTTTVPRDRNYEPRQNVKEGIVNLTKLVNGNFDFEFTHQKEFNTYAMIGTDRSSTLQFIYPGNVSSSSIPISGLPTFNKIYGVGSGFGSEAIISTQANAASQLNYGVHELPAIFNSVKDQDTLDENTAALLAIRKDIFKLPQLVVSGEDFDLNDYGIGDRVYVKIENHPFLASIDGVYRIERIDVSIDENEAEEIRIYFDNYGLDA